MVQSDVSGSFAEYLHVIFDRENQRKVKNRSIKSVRNVLSGPCNGDQVRLSDLQRQVTGHQAKTATLTAQVKDMEEVILQQKKKILVVENRNEKLKSEDPVRRMETMKRKASNQALDAHTK